MRIHRRSVWPNSTSRLKRVHDAENDRQLLFSHRSEAHEPQRVRLASSLAAVALDSHFEHPAGFFPVVEGTA